MKSERLIQVGLVIIILLLVGVIFLQSISQPEKKTLESDLNSTGEAENLNIFELQEQIEELTKELKNLENIRNEINETNQYNYLEISKLRKLVSSIPEIESEIAFITNASEHGHNLIELDYVEWLVGEEAIKASGETPPNGFYVRNETVEKITKTIDDNADIYILDGVSHKWIDITEFKNYLPEETYRLYWVYEINEKIVLIEEQYIP